ncbi:DEAD/DEAH box helicase family protein [bacterium]|nr:DEAD/DEAH box helicase family protein [bacterium]
MFANNRKELNLVNPPEGKKGLRESQLGAVMAATSHFTVNRDPALICMPTGSGKTAVLMALCYLLSAKKVLLITPSQLVRRQIAKDFSELATLQRIGLLPTTVAAPRVIEVKNRVKDEAAWQKLLAEYDVLVATPNSVSPSTKSGISPPPDGAFDVVLVDEAHHSRAKTWADLLAQFPTAKQILLTATPFRRDGRDIRARFVYNYPLRKAVEDETFGEIQYVPIDVEPEKVDREIAKKVEAIFLEDKKAGLEHRVIVRTSRKDRADELYDLYKTHAPSLRLAVVSSNKSMAVIEKAIDGLEKGDLDGIICVDMLGEGFDMPNLKIAGLHAPHKSLAITLQFIGRFARTIVKQSGQKIGPAKFVAALNDMEIEKEKLFREDADWKRIIVDLSEKRIGTELSTQEFFEAFDVLKEPMDADVPQYLSKTSFRPFCHVKVFEVVGGFALRASLDSPNHDVLFHEISVKHQTAVIVWATRKKPKWLKDDVLSNVTHEMVVVHYDPTTRLMFVCSTDRREEFYAHVLSQFVGGMYRELPLTVLRRAMAGWTDERFSSVGMRSRRFRTGTESYQIKAGSNTQLAVHASDGQNYVGGHHVGSGKNEKGQTVLLGLSGTSKMWTIKYVPIPELIEWCDELAVKVSDETHDQAKLPLGDVFEYGEQITAFPNGLDPFAGEWHMDVFKNGHRARLVDSNGSSTVAPLQDLELQVDPKQSTTNRLVFTIGKGSTNVEFDLVLKPFPTFSVTPGQSCALYACHGQDVDGDFVTYLNGKPPVFYFEDMSSLAQKDVYVARKTDVVHFPVGRLDCVDWKVAKVDIRQEVTTSKVGHTSIHDHLKKALLPLFDVLIYDQGAGEVADFIGFENGATPRVVLYHCKGSGKTTAGSRVDDLYEVCGQAIKSVQWADKRRLLENLNNTNRKVRQYLKGTAADAQAIVAAIGGRDFALEIVIVQPGLKSKPKVVDRLARLLGAVDEHLHSSTGSQLRVMCS